MAANGRLIAICLSSQKGTRKSPTRVGLLQQGHGLAGDAHAGTDRQVSLLAQESIEKMQARGFSVGPGDFAENLTTAGLPLHTLPVGARLKVGRDAVLEITQIGKTCHSDCEIRRLTGHCVMPSEGVFAKVLRGGEIRAGDEVEVLDQEDEGRYPHHQRSVRARRS